jgi:hypothetical protein
MILVDLDESYQNILKPSHIAQKNVSLCAQKSYFLFFAPKRHLVPGKKTYVIQLVKGYRNHHHMTVHDLPFVKKWSFKKFIFLDFGYFKGVIADIRNENKRSCVYYGRGSQEQS